MQCGAKTRSGKPCVNPGMANGRCRMHGGKSLKGAESATFKHGKNSKYQDYVPTLLKEKVAGFLEVSNPLDLLGELALTRALLAEFVSRFETTPLDAISISIMSDLVDRINKTVANISKIKNDTALTGAEVTFLAMQMVGLLDRYVTDPTKREAFKQEIFSLVLRDDTILIE